eukprot:Sspe_Gene.20383::Locus_7473_Transcript_1_1_Confidence_1.000_Length_3029::g.20383::m.20383/K04986/PKD2; polycystin 2
MSSDPTASIDNTNVTTSFVTTYPDAGRSILKSHINDELWVITTEALRRYLVKEIEKARIYKQLPFYLLWLLCLTFLVILSGVANTAGYNTLYHLEQAHHHALEMPKFSEISAASDYWQWLRLTVQHLKNDFTQNVPLGFLLMRQYRVKKIAPFVPTCIPEDISRQIQASQFAPEWSDDDVSIEPFGPNGKWVANRDLPVQIDIPAVSTAYHTFSETDQAFPMLLDYNNNLTTLLKQIDEAEAGNWIDISTRVVIVDVLTYNPSTESFAINHLFVEFFASGSSASGSKAYPFVLNSFKTPLQRFVFVLDIGVVIGAVYLLGCVIYTVYLNKKIHVAWISVWEVFEVTIVVFVAISSTFRFMLWADGPRLAEESDVRSSSSPSVTMFVSLFEYGYRFERGNTYTGMTVTMAWLRFLRVLQHNSRLGVLSLTIKYAIGELFSLLVIFAVVLFGYALGCCTLYGADFRDLNSLSRSAGYLIRLLVSAEIGADWQELASIHPEWTWFYLGSFMVLSWLLLLNMVLAIVTGSFASVQAACGGKVADWSLHSLKRDLQRVRLSCGRKERISNMSVKKKVLAVVDGIAKRRGLKADVKAGEFITCCEGVLSEHEARRIFYQADKVPRILQPDEASDSETMGDHADLKELKDDDAQSSGADEQEGESVPPAVACELALVKEQLATLTSMLAAHPPPQAAPPEKKEEVQCTCTECGLSSLQWPYCPSNGQRHLAAMESLTRVSSILSNPPPSRRKAKKSRSPNTANLSFSKSLPTAAPKRISLADTPPRFPSSPLSPTGAGGDDSIVEGSWQSLSSKRPTLHILNGGEPPHSPSHTPSHTPSHASPTSSPRSVHHRQYSVPSPTSHCKECGESLNFGAVFCGGCGSAVDSHDRLDRRSHGHQGSVFSGLLSRMRQRNGAVAYSPEVEMASYPPSGTSYKLHT